MQSIQPSRHHILCRVSTSQSAALRWHSIYVQAPLLHPFLVLLPHPYDPPFFFSCSIICLLQLSPISPIHQHPKPISIPHPHAQSPFPRKEITHYRLGKNLPSSGNLVRTSLSALNFHISPVRPTTTNPKTAVFPFQFEGCEYQPPAGDQTCLGYLLLSVVAQWACWSWNWGNWGWEGLRDFAAAALYMISMYGGGKEEAGESFKAYHFDQLLLKYGFEGCSRCRCRRIWARAPASGSNTSAFQTLQIFWRLDDRVSAAGDSTTPRQDESPRHSFDCRLGGKDGYEGDQDTEGGRAIALRADADAMSTFTTTTSDDEMHS